MHVRSCAMALAACSSAALAQEIITFDGFADTTGLTLSGSAQVLATGDGDVIRLAARNANSGSVFSSVQIDALQFFTEFSFRITEPGGLADRFGEGGADGLAFVIQNVSASLGGGGGGLGYQGVSPSIAVEFDTWGNSWDPSSNHIGISINGNVASVVTADIMPDFDDGDIWYSRIGYGEGLLTVSVSKTDGVFGSPVLTHAIDIPSSLGTDGGFVGFTAGTASAWGNHDLLGFSYNSTVPAPAGAAVLALAGLGMARRR